MTFNGRHAGALVLMGLLGGGGCVDSERTPRFASYQPGHLIFNPPQTRALPGAYVRSDWPSTTGGVGFDETIEYRETINDRQGLSTGERDYLSRRFYSVRTGRIRR